MALTVGVPLALAPGVLFHADVTPKVSLFLVAVAALLLLERRPPEGLWAVWADPAGRLLLIALGLEAASALLSTALSERPDLSFGGTNWRRMGLPVRLAIVGGTLFAAAGLASGRVRLEVLARWAAAGSIPVSLYAVAQLWGWDPLPLKEYRSLLGDQTVVRPPGTLSHAGYLGVCLSYWIFFSAGVAVEDRSRAWRRAATVALACGGAALLVSGSRAAFLGVVLAGGWIAWVQRSRLSWSWAVGAGAAALVATALYLSPAGEPLQARARWIGGDPQGGTRPWLWRDAAAMGAAHWTAGAGIETFSSSFLPYRSRELASRFPEQFQDSPHNVFLDAWTAQGAPGLLALLGVVTAAVVGLQRRCDGPRSWLAAGFFAALAADQFFGFTLSTCWLFFLTAAALAAPEGAGRPAADSHRSVTWILLSTILAAGGLWFAYRLTLADYYAERAKALLADSQALPAMVQHQRSVARRPPGVSTDLAFSQGLAQIYEQTADPSEKSRLWGLARLAAERATVTAEDRQNAWFHVAMLDGRAGRYAEAERELHRAIETDPQWYRPHLVLARMLGSQRRLEEALEHARAAAERAGGRSDEARAVHEALEKAASERTP